LDRKDIMRVVTTLLVLILIVQGAAVIRADDGPKPAGTAPTAEKRPSVHKWTLGSDFDLLPFAQHGYSSGGFIGRNSWRLCDMMSSRTAPSFLVSRGFADRRTDSYAGQADLFFGNKRKGLEGYWAGAGFEYWRNWIRNVDATTDAKYHDFMLTAAGGYRWKFSRHFYLDPGAEGHFVVAGQSEIPVSGRVYRQPVFVPEASVKIGFTF